MTLMDGPKRGVRDGATKMSYLTLSNQRISKYPALKHRVYMRYKYNAYFINKNQIDNISEHPYSSASYNN